MTAETPKYKKTFYGIYDKITCLFIFYFAAYNEQDALRIFHGSGQQIGTSLNHNPFDYSLYSLSDIDEQTGELFPFKPKMIASHLVVEKPIMTKDEFDSLTESRFNQLMQTKQTEVQ